MSRAEPPAPPPTSGCGRAAVLFERLGPYHHARLRALGGRMPTVALEVTGVDDVYAWDNVAGSSGFERITLFSDLAAENGGRALLQKRLRSTLDALHPCAVAIPGWSHPAALSALSWCRATGTPAILMSESTEDDEPRRRAKEAIKRRVVGAFAAGLVGGTRHVAYLCRLGMAKDAIFTRYDVVDNAHFAAGADLARANAFELRRQLGLPERYFLAASRFVSKKNLPRLLHAYALYRRQVPEPWDLVLLGDGPLRPELVRLVGDLGLGDRVLMPGFEQYEQLPAYYGLAGAFVHASTSEQWGLVVNEAMAAGLPVLVSNHCGCAPDLVEHGANGFAFDPHDVAALARLMGRLAHGEVDRTAMGDASRRMIAGWAPERFADRFEKAARVAFRRPPGKASRIDEALLWALMHR